MRSRTGLQLFSKLARPHIAKRTFTSTPTPVIANPGPLPLKARNLKLLPMSAKKMKPLVGLVDQPLAEKTNWAMMHPVDLISTQPDFLRQELELSNKEMKPQLEHSLFQNKLRSKKAKEQLKDYKKVSLYVQLLKAEIEEAGLERKELQERLKGNKLGLFRIKHDTDKLCKEVVDRETNEALGYLVHKDVLDPPPPGPVKEIVLNPVQGHQFRRR